jgi:MYXO-CTERM domain-containing protein
VRLTETVDHEGSLRVRFDVDGADQADFDDNELAVLTDPQNQSGQVWELPVTLPDVTCDRCTLQVVQVMQQTPDPDGGNTYFQCADLVLVDGGGGYLGPSCSSGGTGGGLLSLMALGFAARRVRRRQTAV